MPTALAHQAEERGGQLTIDQPTTASAQRQATDTNTARSKHYLLAFLIYSPTLSLSYYFFKRVFAPDLDFVEVHSILTGLHFLLTLTSFLVFKLTLSGVIPTPVGQVCTFIFSFYSGMMSVCLWVLSRLVQAYQTTMSDKALAYHQQWKQHQELSAFVAGIYWLMLYLSVMDPSSPFHCTRQIFEEFCLRQCRRFLGWHRRKILDKAFK